MALDVLAARLPDVDRRARCLEPAGEEALQRGLLRGGLVPRGWCVEAIEVAREVDDLVRPRRDPVDEGALVGVELAGVEAVVRHRRARDSVRRQRPTYQTRNARLKPTVTARGRWNASGSPSGATRSASSASGREIRSQLFQRSTRPR